MPRSPLALVPLLALAACPATHGAEGMVVLNNSTVTAGTTCTLTGLPGQPFTSQGIIASVSPVGYVASPLIQSRIAADSATDPSQRTIYLQGAIVRLSVPAGSTTIALDPNEASFMAPFSGAVPPDGTANVSFELVPSSVIAKVNALGATGVVHVEVLANVTVFGMLGNDTIDATPWQYPVTICNDCVVFNAGPCATFMGTAATGNPCNVFQDGQVTCCTTATNSLLCPAAMM
jgi:hypothetical protein